MPPQYKWGDSKVFEFKAGQDNKHQYDGCKEGEQWRVLPQGYFIVKLPMKKCVLNWAEGHGSGPVIDQNVEALAWHLARSALGVWRVRMLSMKLGRCHLSGKYPLSCSSTVPPTSTTCQPQP